MAPSVLNVFLRILPYQEFSVKEPGAPHHRSEYITRLAGPPVIGLADAVEYLWIPEALRHVAPQQQDITLHRNTLREQDISEETLCQLEETHLVFRRNGLRPFPSGSVKYFTLAPLPFTPPAWQAQVSSWLIGTVEELTQEKGKKRKVENVTVYICYTDELKHVFSVKGELSKPDYALFNGFMVKCEHSDSEVIERFVQELAFRCFKVFSTNGFSFQDSEGHFPEKAMEAFTTTTLVCCSAKSQILRDVIGYPAGDEKTQREVFSRGVDPVFWVQGGSNRQREVRDVLHEIDTSCIRRNLRHDDLQIIVLTKGLLEAYLCRDPSKLIEHLWFLLILERRFKNFLRQLFERVSENLVASDVFWFFQVEERFRRSCPGIENRVLFSVKRKTAADGAAQSDQYEVMLGDVVRMLKGLDEGFSPQVIRELNEGQLPDEKAYLDEKECPNKLKGVLGNAEKRNGLLSDFSIIRGCVSKELTDDWYETSQEVRHIRNRHAHAGFRKDDLEAEKFRGIVKVVFGGWWLNVLLGRW